MNFLVYLLESSFFVSVDVDPTGNFSLQHYKVIIKLILNYHNFIMSTH